ncbi:MAG TPA: hypothetical protein V6C65_35535, partial [Allocoleopsis sp.]
SIPMTDNYCQTFPEVKAYYDRIRQPVIKYGKNVERLDALEAIDRYEPDVVIGSWVTHWVDPLVEELPDGGGNVYGIKEDEILKRVRAYIVIGSKQIHGTKLITRHPHETYEFPWLKSRRADNVIYVWRNTG